MSSGASYQSVFAICFSWDTRNIQGKHDGVSVLLSVLLSAQGWFLQHLEPSQLHTLVRIVLGDVTLRLLCSYYLQHLKCDSTLASHAQPGR